VKQKYKYAREYLVAIEAKYLCFIALLIATGSTHQLLESRKELLMLG
jgi:hypothetical protein